MTRQTYLRALLILLLAFPSLWLLGTTPPLWRDMDAYVQVTYGPGSGTLLQYSPFYCFPARLPLYLGRIWECVEKNEPWPGGSFFARPVLSDHGVFLLLLSQHALLLLAQLFLLRSITSRLWVQLTLAALLAANASFYLFTHTVGTESLSLVSILLLCGVALRLYRTRSPTVRQWIAYAIVLTLGIVVRHINGVFPAILSGACLFGLGALGVRVWLGRGKHRRPAKRLLISQVRRFGLSVGVGVLSLIAATLIERGLCSAFGVRYSSIAGYAFSWRLNFLTKMNETERAEFLSRTKTKLADPLFQHMLDEVTVGVTPEGNWDLDAYENRIRAVAGESLAKKKEAKEKLAAYRNKLLGIVIASREPHYLAAVRRDYAHAWTITPSDVAQTPWSTTAYYFSHQERMPQLAGLATFRATDANVKLSEGRQRTYPRMFRFPYWSAALFWLGLAGVSCWLSRSFRTFYFTVAVVGSGALLLFVNISLTEYEDRYTLPLWALLLTAILLHAGQCLDSCGRRRSEKRIPCS